ncbi:hypothetical protein C5167_017832 [Papaver somniferum]|uniref:Uncharacterized protein n=1 Tax=Papaver somniferum TaxID=3469 RepID=A0A4Y7IKJ3_PAPSO|nr:hypothetical protein C5167_017832 [Papaver somniferum]
MGVVILILWPSLSLPAVITILWGAIGSAVINWDMIYLIFDGILTTKKLMAMQNNSNHPRNRRPKRTQMAGYLLKMKALLTEIAKVNLLISAHGQTRFMSNTA